MEQMDEIFVKYQTSRVVLQIGTESVLKWSGRGLVLVLVEGGGTIFSEDSGRSC
jgi:hypothetical protein